MDNDFYKLFQEFKAHFDIGMSKDIQAFFCKRQEISKYDITLGQEDKVIINIKLHAFSKKTSKKLFLEFLSFVGYDDINLFFCEKNQTEVRYLYLTQSKAGNGVKMDITIS